MLPSGQRLSGVILTIGSAPMHSRNCIYFDAAENAVTLDRPFPKSVFAQTSYSIFAPSFQEGRERVQGGNAGAGRGSGAEEAGLEMRGLPRSRSPPLYQRRYAAQRSPPLPPSSFVHRPPADRDQGEQRQELVSTGHHTYCTPSSGSRYSSSPATRRSSSPSRRRTMSGVCGTGHKSARAFEASEGGGRRHDRRARSRSRDRLGQGPREGASWDNALVPGGIFIRGLCGDVTCQELETCFDHYCRVLCAAKHPTDDQVRVACEV